MRLVDRKVTERSETRRPTIAMNRSQTLFYATAYDLSGVLSSLEAQKDLQYTLAGLFDSKELQTYSSYRDIPDLGRAFHRSAVANRQYLVSFKRTALRIRDVPQYWGGVLFAVDLRLNGDSIVFSPGGRYSNDVMLYGRNVIAAAQCGV